MNQIPRESGSCERCVCLDTTHIWCKLYEDGMRIDIVPKRLPICLEESPQIITRGMFKGVYMSPPFNAKEEPDERF